MAAGSTYTPIQTTTLGSAQNQVNLTSIPSIYTDLVLVMSNAGFNAGSSAYIRCGNGSIDTGTNYSDTYLYWNGSAASSGRDTSTSSGTNFVDIGTNNYGMGIIHFMNYSNTTTYKTWLARGQSDNQNSYQTVGLWRSTSAINQIQLNVGSSRTFNVGSTFTLYGISCA
jgi:hypothetical protein